MDLLINIDNGGTLTDICVLNGARVIRTKTLTTPHDLSQCVFDGLKKASRVLYGKEDVLSLLLATSYVRYSTTQGTNALVERKGPRIGLILGGGLSGESLQYDAGSRDLYGALIGPRAQLLGARLEDDSLDSAAVRAVNALGAAGANRIVVAFAGTDAAHAENQIKRTLLRTFPPHLLGALPILYTHELVDDDDPARRAWSAIFNAFLHPAMERFLYNTEHKLRDYRTRNPLLIFRNDGHSARVAKTVAIKTYSSGPRGGMEGAKALAANYGFKQLLTMDIGGTTTDIGLIDKHVVRATRRGLIEGVATSFPLCDVLSAGVGGSSIIRVENGQLAVGPQSVGSAPGPACFGLGGTEATITDAFLLMGLLDPASYFGGELRIDIDRARAAIGARVGKPLGLTDEKAAAAMELAWVNRVAGELRHFATITADTTLAAFGGAGPFVVCQVAEAAGIEQVVIPGLAAVFSAYGIGFSDIGHEYSAPVLRNDGQGLAQCRDSLLQRARRGMFAEGASLEECRIEELLNVSTAAGERSIVLTDGCLPAGIDPDSRLSLSLTVVKPVAHATITGRFGAATHPAIRHSVRNTWVAGGVQALPLYRVEDQSAGAKAPGPAVLEEAFFTCRIDPGWQFEINDNSDILLSRA
ncbi:MAG: hydantoinase/oxoprolinase family protein [Steroidobacteraceae bacterium]